MKEVKCPHCGKVIGGFHEDHAQYLLSQHMLTHFEYDTKTKSFKKKGGAK